MKYIDYYTSPLGNITIASDGQSIIGLWFDGQKYDRQILEGEEVEEKSLPVFSQTKTWLDVYFSGREPDFTPPLSILGSAFQKLVDEIMVQIPYGKTMSYGEIAKEIEYRFPGKTVSAQAVGGAVGHNNISLIVPCHRVIGADGSLTGYAGGIDKKEKLLQIEKNGRPAKKASAGDTFLSQLGR